MLGETEGLAMNVQEGWEWTPKDERRAILDPAQEKAAARRRKKTVVEVEGRSESSSR